METSSTGTITKLEKISCCPNDVSKFRGKWIIKDFLSFEETDDSIESPKFLIETATGKLECILHIIEHEGEENIFIYISSLKSNSTKISCQVSILNNKNQPFFTREVEGEDDLDFPYISWEYLRRHKKKLVPRGMLTLICEFFITSDRKYLSTPPGNIEIPECCFQEEIGQLFEENKYCDAVISSANGEEFQVHKNILAKRSPVFAAMFEHDMLENKLNKVEIADVEHAVLKEMLRYIYTGKVENLKTLAYDLSIAANKYRLLRLKALCMEELSNSLTVDNAADILVLSDLQGVDKLKILAADFIIHHLKAVVSSAGWKKLLTSYSYLATEILLRQNKCTCSI